MRLRYWNIPDGSTFSATSSVLRQPSAQMSEVSIARISPRS